MCAVVHVLELSNMVEPHHPFAQSFATRYSPAGNPRLGSLLTRTLANQILTKSLGLLPIYTTNRRSCISILSFQRTWRLIIPSNHVHSGANPGNTYSPDFIASTSHSAWLATSSSRPYRTIQPAFTTACMDLEEEMYAQRVGSRKRRIL